MENKFGSIHFNTIGAYLRKEFGCQISKLSLDGGFTCPNRDGTLGIGGCIYCSEDGAGHFAGDIVSQIQLVSGKWPSGKYIAYFQSHTNTYAPVEVLRAKYNEALSHPDVIGIAIATRPDCLSIEVMELLVDLNRRTYLWVELGLQTKSDITANFINRCYPTSVFDESIEALSAAGIRTVVHLIFGLPGESREDMMDSVEHVVAKKPFGIKIHQLYLMKGTPMESLYPDHIRLLKKEEYIDLVVDALEHIPQEITIHRLTGDAPTHTLIAPLWCLDKRSVLNEIQKEFKRRGSFQGHALF
jgi:radical SAM protein (TIGR01212 family)